MSRTFHVERQIIQFQCLRARPPCPPNIHARDGHPSFEYLRVSPIVSRHSMSETDPSSSVSGACTVHRTFTARDRSSGSSVIGPINVHRTFNCRDRSSNFSVSGPITIRIQTFQDR
ncbi:hypothetical protein AVEN_212801-1 [Araneus ventricosus]|uniref:Uncharacterized protein n=1 Tax=Araneus ventricosus TaxID=182803 RepID=A0A4Y2L2C6_ARAVE|nr:hypothetical protein AVEN_212801-1 [Araneus ventricosus]